MYVSGPDVREDRFCSERADSAARGDERKRRDQHFVAGLHATCAEREDQRVRSGRDADAVSDAAELRDFLLERGAFAPENKLLRRKNAFDGGSNLRANRGVLRREIELRNGVEQGSGLWMRAHRLITCGFESSAGSNQMQLFECPVEYTPTIRRRRLSPVNDGTYIMMR